MDAEKKGSFLFLCVSFLNTCLSGRWWLVGSAWNGQSEKAVASNENISSVVDHDVNISELFRH